jgi:rhamnosyltransferase
MLIHKVSRTFAIITTFSPDDFFLSRIDRVVLQVCKVIIIDDSGCNAISRFEPKLTDKKILIIRNSVNMGIASSLNTGIKKASELGAKFILTLDDDTLIPFNYLNIMMDALKKNEKGVVSGRRGNHDVDILYKNKRNLITSGCLCSIDLFKKVGLFNESLFIDLVDFEFCTRVRKNGYGLVEIGKVRIDHSVGDGKDIQFLFFKIHIFNHSPFRNYYQIRNVWLYMRLHGKSDSIFSLYLVWGSIKLLLKILFLEDQTWVRIKYAGLGFFHGIRNISGRLR